MADKSHLQIDKKLARLEARLSAVYARAEAEIEQTAKEYFEKFEKLDEQKKKLVESGKLTEDEYITWRKNKILYGKRFTEMKEQCARQILEVNKTAIAYVNGELPEVYSLGYNALAPDVDGVGGYTFTLLDADTVKNLAIADKSLLPKKKLAAAKDIAWNMKNINAEALQGILQGESMDKIAKRMRKVEDMNLSAAIRTARTLVTGAENKGRHDSYVKAEKDGIILKNEWIATFDMRTRDAHTELDGQIRGVNEPFENSIGKIMYPGDPNADPSNVYNCRCTTASVVLGFDKSKMSNQTQADRETVSKWLDKEREKDPEAFEVEKTKIRNESSDRALLQKYRDEFGKNAPKSLAKLQEMKYNNPVEWNQYKTYLRSIRSGELSAFADFKLYKATSQQIDLNLIGKTTTNGITIMGKSDHFIARVIGSHEQRRDGVSLKDIEKALTNENTQIMPIKTYSNNQQSQKFRLNGVEVTVNPNTGKLIQTNPYTKKGVNNVKN